MFSLLRKSARAAVVVASALALAATTACGGAASGDPKSGGGSMADFTLAVTDPSLSVYNALYTSIPIQKGYWKEEGLNVFVQGAEGATVSAQSVQSGQVQASVGGVGGFYPSTVSDPSMRLVGMTRSIYQIVTFGDSSIHQVSELKGKTIGVVSLASSAYYLARAIVEDAGLNPDTDVMWLPVGVGGQAAAAHEGGDIDALALWDSAHTIVGDLLGKQVNVLESPLNGLPAMHAFLVNGQLMKDKPQEAEGFLRGVFKSAAWAEGHLDEAVRLHWKQYPEQAPKPENEAQAMDQAKSLLALAVDAYLPEGKPASVEPAVAQATADLLVSSGATAEKVDVSKITDFDLTTKAAEFDMAAVEAGDAK